MNPIIKTGILCILFVGGIQITLNSFDSFREWQIELGLSRKCDKHLYLIYDSKADLYKIGYTKHLDQRIHQIARELYSERQDQTRLIYTERWKYKGCLEKELHEKYREFRVYRDKATESGCSTEWFKLNTTQLDDLREYVMIH